MINISKDYKTAMTQPIKQIRSYIQCEDQIISNSDDLVNIKLSCESSLCKTAMKKVEIKILGNHDLLGKEVIIFSGVKISNGTYEYIRYGSFLIVETSKTKNSDVSTLIGYDMMIRACKIYNEFTTYPCSILDYITRFCGECNLTLGTDDFPNKNKIIEKELFSNFNNITFRDILTQLAEVTGTTIIIGNDDKLYLKSVFDTKEKITYSNLFKYTLDNKCGPINSIVLSRQPQEDNIVLRDEQSINSNGLCEFKIINNEFLDKNRDDYIIEIFDNLNGIEYYPFNIDTEGLGWFEIADSFTITDDTGNICRVILFNYTITIDGGIKENLYSNSLQKTSTNYGYAGTINQRLKNTELVVNKQDQSISSLITDVYDENGILNENFTKVHQDINNIINSIQNSGGANLIKNSVMFAYDTNNIPSDWEVIGDGTLTIQATQEAKSNGISGNIFTLNNKSVKQKIMVKTDSEDIPIEQKTYYTFSCKIKKDIFGSCYVKIYNDLEEYLIELPIGVSSFYGEYEIKKILPKQNFYYLEFYADNEATVSFTDNMFCIGEYKSLWQQANGEIMNTQVNINLDGVLVKSSVFVGDYTIMSPLEFSGYSNINGVITKVFTLNKDTTEVKKIQVNDEIKMPPIKIVPIMTGDLQGWAFVSSIGVTENS